MTNVKDKFFIVENGENLVLENFNYEYTRNQLLKFYSPNKKTAIRFMCTIILRDGGNYIEKWDVRQVDLSTIFFSNTRLSVLALMLEDITYESYRYDDKFPVPNMLQRWKTISEGRKPDVTESENNLPEVQKQIPARVYTREVLDVNDARLPAIKNMYPDLDSMAVLDWVVNYETCLHEASTNTVQLSEEQLRVSSILQKCSAYVNTEVVGRISEIMKQSFPDNRGFFGKLFGAEVKVETPSADSITSIANGLRNALSVNASQFVGADQWFIDLIQRYEDHMNVLNVGVKAGEYMLVQSADDEVLLRRYNRTNKMHITANMSLMTVRTGQISFNTEMERLQEIRDVLVPILISKLQCQTTGDVDNETLQMINRLKSINTKPVEVSDR